MSVKAAPKTCLRCGSEFEVRQSTALYAEAFCGAECEREFARHVIEFYGARSELKVLAWMLPGRA